MQGDLLYVNDYKMLPNAPGVYRYYDEHKQLIYVGKAKILKRRVESYFKKNEKMSIKTIKLVDKIRYIGFTVVESEHEALLLENNLIKTYKPKYNILLKDSKSYPYIVLTNEKYPRIITTERLDEEYKYVFGPFSNRDIVKDVIELVQKVCQLRTCKYDLANNTKKNVNNVCLEYHLGNCCGICEHKISDEEYNDRCSKVMDILKGNFKNIKLQLKRMMQESAKNMNYKLAQKYKEQLDSINNYTARSVITNPTVKDLDVFTTKIEDNKIFTCYMMINGGMITFIKNDEVPIFLGDNIEIKDILDHYKMIYHRSSIKTIVNDRFEDVNCFIAKTGYKKQLVDMALKNIEAFIHELKMQQTMHIDHQNVLIEIKQCLHLNKVPCHIECFDNSNLQGTNPVASCVVFKNGEPSKSDYRHFKIRTVTGADDYATMKEVIYRRYKSICTLPDLIIVDGGRGQLNAAIDILKQLNIFDKVDIIGIAKQFEEIYFPNRDKPLILAEDSKSLRLIQNIRNEAHRFAVTFHRKIRSKNFINDNII